MIKFDQSEKTGKRGDYNLGIVGGRSQEKGQDVYEDAVIELCQFVILFLVCFYFLVLFDNLKICFVFIPFDLFKKCYIKMMNTA